MSDWEPFTTMNNGEENGTENVPENLDNATEPENSISSIDTVEEKTAEDTYKSESIEDTYQSESTEAIYRTPSTETVETERHNTQGVFSGIRQDAGQIDSQQPDGTEQTGNVPVSGAEQPSNSQPYGNNSQWQGQPGNGQPYGNNSQWQGQPGNGQPYGNSQWQGQPGNGQPYGNNSQWQGQPGNGQSYGNGQWQGQPGNGQSYGNSQWQGQPGNGQPYGNGQWQGQPYGVPPYGVPGNNPYSPYAVPQKKNHTGLIVGIVIAVVVLFLAAIIALCVRVAQMIKEDNRHSYQEDVYDEDDYDFDSYDDDDYEYNDNEDNIYHYDEDDEIDEDYTYDEYDYDSEEYYTLHDDLKDNLSYSIDFEYVEYDTDNENVMIMMAYPVISGKDVPNLDKINEALASEMDQYVEFYEETYAPYMTDEDNFFYASINGYVAYMDEDKLSVVYKEDVYGDYTEQAYLECVNIDMKNGMILDNTQMLSIDDDFSVEFREKSDIQNGSNSYLDSLTDQEITEYFNSRHIIVFYVPQGMEIGINHEDGWITVTYPEYEQYLKSF